MTPDDFLSARELAELGLAAVGRDVRVSRHALFFSPERISIGDHSRIDAFCILSAGEPHLRIGRHVHISAYVAILGRASVEIGDFSGLSARVTILSSTDDFSGSVMTGPTVPEEFRSTFDAPVIVSAHVVVGAGSIVLPGVTIGESAAVGAASLVRTDVPPFALVAGVPARQLRMRSREHRVLAEEFLAREAEAARESGNETTVQSSAGPGSEEFRR